MLPSLLVFVGGGLGALARFQMGLGMAKVVGASFPYGTISINVIGSFLLALIMGLSQRTTWIHPDLRLFLTTGIMGGYTTYSTFNYETLTLLQQDAWWLGVLNFVTTGGFCLLGGIVGLGLARVLGGV